MSEEIFEASQKPGEPSIRELEERIKEKAKCLPEPQRRALEHQRVWALYGHSFVDEQGRPIPDEEIGWPEPGKELKVGE